MTTLGRSVFLFSVYSSFLVMVTLVFLDLNGIHLDATQLIHIAAAWLIVNLLYTLIKIILHE